MESNDTIGYLRILLPVRDGIRGNHNDVQLAACISKPCPHHHDNNARNVESAAAAAASRALKQCTKLQQNETLVPFISLTEENEFRYVIKSVADAV